ncbi:hypothetical protein GF326_05800 [Candidatus Bathyarchaeota archaeon]|nr:hypothetical protein [Candidatus Bathyarchaeota archaeon]
MSQQHTLEQQPVHQETSNTKQEWWDLLTTPEQRLILLIQDYQEDSQQWIDYEPGHDYPGVRHGALQSWTRAEELMTEDELEQSLQRMVSDPRIPLKETSMSTEKDRRYELRYELDDLEGETR